MKMKVSVYLGCLIVGLSLLGVNASAGDLQTAIIASRVIGADNDTDNETDLCIFNAQLDLVHDTANQVGYQYMDVATGNFTHSGYAEAIVCVLDIPDNDIPWPMGDNLTSFNRMFFLVAGDNVTLFQDSNHTGQDVNKIFKIVKTIEYGNAGDLDEFAVLQSRPKYDYTPRFPATPEYPSPTHLLRVAELIVFEVTAESLPDNVTIEIALITQTWTARGGEYSGFDWADINRTGVWKDFWSCRFNDNVREGHDYYWERAEQWDQSWKWNCDDAHGDPWDWDNSTPECDNDFPGNDVIPYLSNVHHHTGRLLNNRSSLVYNTVYRDTVCLDLNYDGYVEAVVTADCSMLEDNDTGEPYLSHVAMYETWTAAFCGYCEWWPADKTSKFAGRPTKTAKGQFDADGNDEFVIINLLDNETNTEIRIYNDNLTLLATSSNVPGKFTRLLIDDLDNDGIDEIIVGYLHADGQNSTIRVYDASASLLDESNSQAGYFTGLAITQIPLPAGPVEPTTCAEVWSMGYGMQTDLDKTCKVDWGDFSVFASNWLATDCGNPADFDGTCLVDWGDFSVFASTWLDCNDPTNMPPCIANW